MKLNKKGFTLIEIMVTLIISSIVMLIAGTIILNSFGYFNKTEKADVDKLAVDKIAELVRDELVYASKVVVADERPDEHDWNAFSINADGYLLKTVYEGTKSTDIVLYNEEFYNHSTLELKARCYNNDYRMDLSFAFLDNDLEQKYKTEHTLELINMKSTTTLTDSDSSDKHSELLTITGTRRIYYQKGGNDFRNDIPTLDGSGTVADEIKCKNKVNDKGAWVSGTSYVQGDFVYILDKSTGEKIWYRLTIAGISTSNSPETTWEWKKINMNHDNKSRYMKGDIIIFNKLYYQAINDTEFDPTVITVWSSGYKTIDELKASKGYIIPQYSTCENGCKIVLKTVEDEICEMSPVVSEPGFSNAEKPADNTNNIGDFQSNYDKFIGKEPQRWYYNGDFVSLDGHYYRYVSDVSDTRSGIEVKPGTEYGGIKRIDMNWTMYSAYETDDVIKYNNVYYRAKKYIRSSRTNPQESIFPYKEDNWEQVVPNATNDAWVTK